MGFKLFLPYIFNGSLHRLYDFGGMGRFVYFPLEKAKIIVGNKENNQYFIFRLWWLKMFFFNTFNPIFLDLSGDNHLIFFVRFVFFLKVPEFQCKFNKWIVGFSCFCFKL